MKHLMTARLSTLLLSISTALCLSGCEQTNQLLTDIQSAVTTSVQKTAKANTAETAKHTTNTASQAADIQTKKDLFELLGRFEEACGRSANVLIDNSPEQMREQRYQDFQKKFMARQVHANYSYTPYVKPNYQLPETYRDTVKKITVHQDEHDGIHYFVHFQNATYRGYDLDRLEIFDKPETDFFYDKLYFKDASFIALKPLFKQVEDELDPGYYFGGKFDLAERSITCD